MGSRGLFGFGYSFYSELAHPSPAPARCLRSKTSQLPRDLFLPLLCLRAEPPQSGGSNMSAVLN